MNYIDTTGEAASNATQAPLPKGVKRVNDDTIMHANRQWASRRPDEAVWTMEELVARTRAVQMQSRQTGNIPWSQLQVVHHVNGEDLCLTKGAGAARFTHWSLSQLCNLPSADGTGSLAAHSFLSKLTPRTAALVLNERLQAGVGRRADAQLLFRVAGDVTTLRAITTDKYTRIYDHEIVSRLASLVSRTTWQPAEAFRSAEAAKVAHAWGESTSLPLGWLGDRDMYTVLVDYEGAVMVNGVKYARFVMIRHSEVGDGAFWMMWGLFSFVCCNFIMWGCRDVFEMNLRHTAGITSKWQEIAKALDGPKLGRGEAADIGRGILAASNTVLGTSTEEVFAVVKAATKLPETLILEAHERATRMPAYGNPNSVWGMLNGLTEASQHATSNTDRRVQIDVAAARLMALVK